MQRLIGRIGLLCAVAVLTAVLTAGVASAHAVRVAAQGKALTSGADQASATCSEGALAAMTVTGPNESLRTPGPAAAPRDPDADMPVWPFAVGTIVAVGVVAFWSTRRRP